MTRTKRLRKLREQLKRLHAAGISADDVFKQLFENVKLSPVELDDLTVYCEELYDIGPDTYKQMLGEERYAKVMAGYDQEWRERHGGVAEGGRTDMGMSKEALDRLDEGVKEVDEDAADDTPWKRKMRQFHREIMKEGGAFGSTIIRPQYIPYVLSMGEGRYLKVISQWFEMVRATGQRPLCLACEHEFDPDGAVPTAFCFSVPFCNEPTNAIVTAICEECGEKDDNELLEIAYQGFKKMGLANRKLETGTA